jgi:hypothetical protein
MTTMEASLDIALRADPALHLPQQLHAGFPDQFVILEVR